MNLQQYQEEAKRTNANLGSQALNNIHMVLGITSEIVEYNEAIEKADSVNIGEELADMCWYIANYCSINQFYLESINSEQYIIFLGGAYSHLVSNISELANIHKREIAYNKLPERHLQAKYISNIFNCVKRLCHIHGLRLDYILDRNIHKLRVRFPEKFTEEKALNRNLKEERKELEK